MSQKRKHTHPTAELSQSPAHLLSSSLIGFLCALIAILPISALCAALCLLAKDPNTLTVPCALLSLGLSSLIGGFCATRRHGSAPLPCGMLCGVLLMLLSYLLSWIFASQESVFSAPIAHLLRLGILLFTLLGALLGAHKKSSRRHRRQKR